MLKIYIDEKLQEEFNQVVYRCDGNLNDADEVLLDESFDSNEAYETCMYYVIKKNDKYYFFGSSRNGSWSGYKVNQETAEKLATYNINQLVKTFQNYEM